MRRVPGRDGAEQGPAESGALSRAASRSLDVYLFPAVVGGGLGDVEEVLLAGRRLARAGFRPLLFRVGGRALPPSVGGPWEWPRVERIAEPITRSPRALTISPMWGVSAAPARDEPLGRAGPWSLESEGVERAYGPERVVHASLEEFARTWTSRRESSERYREGGMPVRDIPQKLAGRMGQAEIARFHEAYRKFRGFDRPNVVHLFATFRPSLAFAREYPEAIQCGPLWPEPENGSEELAERCGHRREWIWYASPASSDRLGREIERGLDRAGAAVRVAVRSPRRLEGVRRGARWRILRPLPPRLWRKRFRAAELRIVTGSRTLLEALQLGGPFLYFNGVTGVGRARRRHRPEKLLALLAALPSGGRRAGPLRDLRDFSLGRRVAAICRRAATDARWRAGFRGWQPTEGFRPPFDDLGQLLVRLAGDWAVSSETSWAFISAFRSKGHRARIAGGEARREGP